MNLHTATRRIRRPELRDVGAVLAGASALAGAASLTTPVPDEGGGDLAFTRYTAAAGGDEIQVTSGDVVDFRPDWSASPAVGGGADSFTWGPTG